MNIETDNKNSENIVFIGNKPSMRYVLAVVTEFNGGETKEVAIKARGNSISKAADVAEIVKNRYIKEAKYKEIIVGTEKVTNDDGKDRNVSFIEIYLSVE
jgi:DNA-binding protein